MTKQTKAAPLPPFADPVDWVEDWVTLNEIIQHPDLQVRAKGTNPQAVNQYRDMTKAGKTPPPIKVARVNDKDHKGLFLVDGWHRMEAGALETMQLWDNVEVKVAIASMSMREAALQAAAANQDHGERLKPQDREAVFKAFIRAGRHRTKPKEPGSPKGFLSYRELAAVTGIPRNTLHRLMKKCFPSIAAQMSGELTGEGGLQDPSVRSVLTLIMCEVDRLAGLAQALQPHERDEVSRKLHELMGPVPSKLPKHSDSDEF